MLQFEFDIRESKIKSRESRGRQLALGISFLISAVLLLLVTRYFNFFCQGKYLSLILLVISMYFFGLLMGLKFLYSKEYLIINSRKIKYKHGWGKKEIRIYLKDVKQILVKEHKMQLFLKNKEEILLDLTHISDHGISVLKNYLNIED